MTTAHVIGFIVGLACGLTIGGIVILGLLNGVRSAIREHTAKCKAMVDAQKASTSTPRLNAFSGLTDDDMLRLARTSGEAHTAMAAGRQMAIAKSHTNPEP